MHAGKSCGVLCLGWSVEKRRGHDRVAALGPCCLPSLLGAFRTFRVCSAGLLPPHKTSMAETQCQAGEGSWLNLNLGSNQTTIGKPRSSKSKELANSNHPSLSTSACYCDINTSAENAIVWMHHLAIERLPCPFYLNNCNNSLYQALPLFC